MNQPSLTIDGVHVPRFIYGTAWKEGDTQRLVELAIEQGFRGIDTANQRRHYHEAAVGKAISASIDRDRVGRDELFLQSKYTFRRGQDHRLPYDPEAPIPIQVEQSLASSLEHLSTDHLDSFLLHGPQHSQGLTSEDWAAWRAMEAIHDSGRARIIGVSNVTLDQLRCLVEESRIRPRVVQNRCYAVLGWDRHVREFCAANGIVDQAFSLLTANGNTLASPELAQLAKHKDRTAPQIVFRFAIDIGMIPLTGTTNADHMRQDLDVFDFKLDEEEVKRIEGLEFH